MRSVAALALGPILLLGSARADSTGLDEMLGPREIAVGEAMRGGATGATAIGLNPAGLPLNRELVFEGGYGYRASDSASMIGVSACDSTVAAPGCFFYDYIGSNPELEGSMESRRTHVGGLAIGRQFVPRVSIGATVKYFDYESSVMGEDDSNGTAFDLGATLRLTEMVNLGVSGQNLYSTEKSVQFPRAAGGGLQARPFPSLTLSFDMRWKLVEDGGMRYGGGAEWFLRGSKGRTGYPIRVGGLRDEALGSTYVSGGIGMASMSWGIDIGARREVKGGDDTLVIASMRFFGPREPAPSVE
ncbi:MAG TPA: hypothetical protein VIU61_17900 [Kofleriaceae bacterium]